MAKPKYMLNDVEAASNAVQSAKDASDKIRAICHIIKTETANVANLNATFSTNTQVANRYDQLQKQMGDIIPMLDDIVATVDRLVKQSINAMEMSKNKRI